MRTFKIVASSLLFVTMFSLVYSQSTWKNVDVSATGRNESSPDVTVEANGTAHIVFVKETVKVKRSWRDDLFYASTAGNNLSTPVQITNLGVSLSDPVIAVDNNGKLHVAVSNGSNDSVIYLNNVNGSFTIVAGFGQDSSSWPPIGVDMDIDAMGHAHITYYSSINGVWHIFYATNGSGMFIVSDLGTLGFDGANQPTIAEHNGVVHIAFHRFRSASNWHFPG